MNNQERFICISRQNNAKFVEVWVDTKTGVNYLFLREGFAGGLTPLLDADGKPIISKEYVGKN